LSKRGVQKFDIRRDRDEELDSDDEEDDEDSLDAVDAAAMDSEMSELEISSFPTEFPTEEELENMESTASNTSSNKKREADNFPQEQVHHDAITVEQQSSPTNIKKKKISKKTIKWSFVAGFFTAFATGAMIIWMAGSSDEKEVTVMPDDEGEQ